MQGFEHQHLNTRLIRLLSKIFWVKASFHYIKTDSTAQHITQHINLVCRAVWEHFRFSIKNKADLISLPMIADVPACLPACLSVCLPASLQQNNDFCLWVYFKPRGYFPMMMIIMIMIIITLHTHSPLLISNVTGYWLDFICPPYLDRQFCNPGFALVQSWFN